MCFIVTFCSSLRKHGMQQAILPCGTIALHQLLVRFFENLFIVSISMVVMSELLYQAPNKDYFCEAKPSTNDPFACKLFLGLIKCQAHNKPLYKNLYFNNGVMKIIFHTIKISLFTIYIIRIVFWTNDTPRTNEQNIVHCVKRTLNRASKIT